MNNQETKQQPAATLNVPASDRVTVHKTIYEVGAFEVFWRNIIAGMGRALGGIVLYALFLFVVGTLMAQFLMPQISPLINSYTQAMKSLGDLNNLAPAGIDPQAVQDTL